jgi:tetratricopeptide (TPR) repeat protein
MANVPRLTSAAVVCACLLAIVRPSAAQATNPLAELDTSIAAAEENLRSGEFQIAESRYRTALLQGWMILGGIHASNGRWSDARRAFERASSATIDSRSALQALAMVQLQMGDTASALDLLTRMASASPRDIQTRLTLAEALMGAGRAAEAAQELDEVQASGLQDLESTFALATGYLRIGKPEAAEKLFAKVIAERPVPETYVLIGRTYRDLKDYNRARTALEQALKLDPRTPRAHYYLGTSALMEEGVVRLDEAIADFREELKISPNDRAATLRLGMALAEARRPEEALPFLERAAKASPDSAEAWTYLGRCQLALKRPAEAVTSLERALQLAAARASTSSDKERLRPIYYQLGTALRATGAAAEADKAFAEAERLSTQRNLGDRERLAQYLGEAEAQDGDGGTPRMLSLDVAAFGGLTPAERETAANRVRTALARAYLNLGILQAQGTRFSRAAELFEVAAELDPAFPQVQYSLGVAYFNAQMFDKAVAPLTHAVEQQPANADVARMLALAAFNVEDYARAVELLGRDPQIKTDPALQYAYGVALVRSGRAEDAERIFARVLTQNPDVPELNVVLGQAHAAQGDYDGAIASFRRALELKADVADANAALGAIYLRQGNLPAARDALHAELKSHPDDVRARNTLATVLDLEGERDEALKELRTIVAKRPNYAEARYLFGKILLAQGAAAEAVVHLELAAQLSPDDSNVHYQLGQAYQRLGKSDLAAKEFETFQRLKAKSRGGTP